MPRKRREVPWLDTRDGVYNVFWYDPAKGRTERLSLRTSDPDEATGRYAAFLAQGRDIYAGGQRTGLTCGAALDFYVAEHVKVKVVDSVRAENAITNLRLGFNDMQVRDVDIPACRRYAEKRASGEWSVKTKHGRVRKGSPGTIKRELTVLRAAIGHCVAWKHGGLTKADIPTLEKPKTKRSKGLWLFHEELQALRAAADQKTRDFIDLAYFTGARKRSIETLTWFQVDMVRGRINLAKPDDPVTKKRKPIVPISSELRPILERLSNSRVSEFVMGGNGNCWSGFKTARKKCGLRYLEAKDMRPAGSVSPHILRHSRATHLLQSGAKPKFVADLLGDDIMTVLRVYGHACPDWMANEMGVGEGE